MVFSEMTSLTLACEAATGKRLRHQAIYLIPRILLPVVLGGSSASDYSSPESMFTVCRGCLPFPRTNEKHAAQPVVALIVTIGQASSSLPMRLVFIFV